MASQYPRNRITRGGYNLLAESIATKKQLIFTKVVIGDGDDKGQDINTMATVLSPKMTLPVTDGRKDGDGQYLVQATLSNNEVETGFFPKEVALFAKIDGGTEIMYSYTNGGNMVGFIPDKNTPIDSEIYNVRTKIGNAENVTFSHVDSTYVTAGQLEEHNTDPNAHGGLMTKVKNEVKVATDALATHNTDNNAHAAKFAKYLEKAKLYITSGEVEDGGTVPIPSGFARNECTVLVSLKSSNVAQGYFDIRESGISTALQTECSYDSSTGTVHVGLWVRGTEHSSLDKNRRFDGAGDAWYKGTATYICIAQKA